MTFDGTIELKPSDLVKTGEFYEDHIETVVKYFLNKDYQAFEWQMWLAHPLAKFIIYSFENDPIVDKLLSDFYHELQPTMPDIHPFVLSLFHEIGHCGGMVLFTTEEDEAIEAAMDAAPTYEATQYLYIRKSNERAATEWGAKKIMENLDIVLQFDEFIHETYKYFGWE